MMHDPRSELSHDIEAGNVYVDQRTDTELVVLFVDDNIALLKDDDGAHRMEPRKQFERNVGSDRYSLTDTQSVDGDTLAGDHYDEIDYESIDGVGSTTAQHLVDAGYSVKGDIRNVSDDELLDVYGVGQGNLSNIREAVE